jgi:HSP90 family molecular chaperone
VRKCLAELVANSYDADAHHVNVSIPDVIDENASVALSDDGNGMSVDDVKTKFLYIGRNRRLGGDRTVGKRLIIGSKGIGKLAGFGIASQIKLTTRQGGKQTSLIIDRDELDSIHELVGHQFDITITDTTLKNGTTIELFRLHDGLQLPTADVIRRHLHRVMPNRSDFIITVNNVECTADDVVGEKSDFSEDIPEIIQVCPCGCADGQFKNHRFLAWTRSRTDFSHRKRSLVKSMPSSSIQSAPVKTDMI